MRPPARGTCTSAPWPGRGGCARSGRQWPASCGLPAAPRGAGPVQAMADDFTRDLFAWLNVALADRRIGPFAFQVAYVLSQHVNRETGEAWPSQDRIAERMGGSARGVRKALHELQAAGLVAVASGGGRHVVNRYRLAGGGVEKPSAADGETRNGGAGYSEKPGTVVPGKRKKPGTVAPRIRCKTRHRSTRNPERWFLLNNL